MQHIRTMWLTLAVGLLLTATGCADGVLRLTFVTATPAVVAPPPTPITDTNIVINAQVVPAATAVVAPSSTAVAQPEATPGSIEIIEPGPATTA